MSLRVGIKAKLTNKITSLNGASKKVSMMPMAHPPRPTFVEV